MDASDRFPSSTTLSLDIRFGDVDGDGDPDAVLVYNTARPSLFINDGTGSFVDMTAARMPNISPAATQAGLADVDGDGDLDMVIAVRNARSRLFLNDGNGGFSDATVSRLPDVTAECRDAECFDADGDGDLDLLFTTTYGKGLLFLNNGSGYFTDASATHLPGSNTGRSACVGDVDGDGDLDIVQGIRVYLNDGAGHFAAGSSFSGLTDPRGHGLADADGDGDLDLAVADFTSGSQSRFYLNNGAGAFMERAGDLPSDAGRHADVAWVDVDDDGDADLVFSGVNVPPLLYLNDGTGRFTDDSAHLPAPGDVSSYAVDAADADGDGDADLAFSSSNPSALLFTNQDSASVIAEFNAAPLTGAVPLVVSFTDQSLGAVTAWLWEFGDGDTADSPDPAHQYNIPGVYSVALTVTGGAGSHTTTKVNHVCAAGNGLFTDGSGQIPLDYVSAYDLAAGDVDRDGSPDIVLANNGSTAELYLNNGDGAFADATESRMPGLSALSSGVALGDLDGDGDLDAVFANRSSQNWLFLNDGSGAFADGTAGRLPADASVSRDVALGDVDGDGDLDILFGNEEGGVGDTNRLCLNTGGGYFQDVTATHIPAGMTARDADLGDVDGDGDLDLACADDTGPPHLYLNDGAGHFTDATAQGIPSMSVRTRGLALGDVDGDGDLDMVLADWDDPNKLLLNDGTGVFNDATAILFPADAGDRNTEVRLVDVDLDNDLDIVFAACEPDTPLLYLNFGSGFFDASVNLPAGAFGSYALEAADVDGDGDPDLVLAAWGSYHRLFINGYEPPDEDGDGLNCRTERNALGTSPTSADTDNDGLTDWEELFYDGSQTYSPLQAPGGGMAAGGEEGTDTNATLADTDGDGLIDGAEVDFGSDPLRVDTDADGSNDGEEYSRGTNPTVADTDGDGLLDGEETSSNPLDADSDDDMVGDYVETVCGANPVDGIPPATIRVNFQPAASAGPAGFVPASPSLYSAAKGYGWAGL